MSSVFLIFVSHSLKIYASFFRFFAIIFIVVFNFFQLCYLNIAVDTRLDCVRWKIRSKKKGKLISTWSCQFQTILLQILKWGKKIIWNSNFKKLTSGRPKNHTPFTPNRNPFHITNFSHISLSHQLICAAPMDIVSSASIETPSKTMEFMLSKYSIFHFWDIRLLFVDS